MFLAPALAPDKRRRWLFRFAGGIGSGFIAAVLLAVNLILLSASYYLVNPSVTPREFYHRNWLLVKENLHDADRLENWDEWEHRFDDKIETHDDAVRYVNQMLSSLDDPYTFLMPPEAVRVSTENAEGVYVGIGVTFKPDGLTSKQAGSNSFPEVEKVVPGGPAAKAGLKAGDRIEAVDGVDTSTLSPGQLANLIKGELDTAVTLRVDRKGTKLDLSVIRGHVNVPVVATRRFPDNNLGYIRIDAFDQLDTAAEIRQALLDLSDVDGLIIDLRNNPGGFIHEELKAASLFLDSGILQTIHMRVPGRGHMTYDIRLTESSAYLDVTWGPFTSAPVPIFYRMPNLSGTKPVVILVNRNTASAAEGFTSALQDNGRATVIGTKTFGKGVGQIYLPAGNGYRLRITNLRSYTPDGTWLGDGGRKGTRGIDPDLVVMPQFGIGIGGPFDKQLNSAVDFLLKQAPAKKQP